MNQANGNGQLPDPAFAGLEDALRTATADVVAQHEPEVLDDPLHPSFSATAAGDTVHQCRLAAEHVRAMGKEFADLARSMEQQAEILAQGFESRAQSLHDILGSLKQHSADRLAMFERERGLLRDLKMPGV